MARRPAPRQPTRRPCSRALSTKSAAATGSFRLQSAAIGSQRAVGTGATHRVRSASQRLRSARLGAGLTTIPPIPLVDAAKVVMKNPEVAEDKRTCAKCGSPVGRSKDGRPGRTEGFCPTCGQEFSFTPKLHPGDLVAGQYEVAGCLAHGGLGWIYLARDKNVSDRWVVLKGLLNSGDADALAAAIAEQRFLAQVEHPLIVEIYNFVTHEDAGYIVMEYVGGRSLKQVLKERMRANSGAYDPLPVDQALAYILEILPAFQYLHDLGLVYCDFKPDNLIQVGDALKLIDLGGVRHVDDQESAIYGTVGYQAPEVAVAGPSVASDIYTIGRTLVVLCMEFKGYQSTYLSSLPDPESTPLFRDNDSLYCLVAKCCATDPADRFQSADELRVQLLGVLREVVAKKRAGTAITSAASQLFETPAVTTVALDWDQLPDLRDDTSDTQHAWLTSLAPVAATKRLEQLQKAPEETAEVRLWRAEAALEADDTQLAIDQSAALLQADPWEWRALWVSGLAALQQSRLGRRGRGLQRGLQAGPRRAGAQAGPGAGLREGRPPRGGRGLLQHVRRDRRGVRRPLGVRDGPHPRRQRRHRRGRRGPRPGAADQPRVRRVAPAAGRGAAARRGRRPDAAECRDDQRRRRGDGALRPGQAVGQDPRARARGGREEGTGNRADRQLRGQGAVVARGPGGELPGARP